MHRRTERPASIPLPPFDRASHLRLAQAARFAAERAYLDVPANDLGDSVEELADALVDAFFARLRRQHSSG